MINPVLMWQKAELTRAFEPAQPQNFYPNRLNCLTSLPCRNGAFLRDKNKESRTPGFFGLRLSFMVCDSFEKGRASTRTSGFASLEQRKTPNKILKRKQIR